jgi:uncharacterized protein YegP (UPF0339 family)
MTPKTVDEAVNILFERISQKRKSGFRFKAPNGKNMFASEGYKTKLFAMKTIESKK